MYRGQSIDFFKSHNFHKFTGFWCGYGCIKRDKTDRTNSDEILLLKHKINDVLHFGVKNGF